MNEPRGPIYNLTLAEAETGLGMLMKIITDKDREIERAEKEEWRVKQVLDFISRVR